MKKVVCIPAERNSERNKAKRRDFAEWLQSVSDSEFIFFDESGFDLWQGRTRGRSKVGEPAKRTVGGQRRPHLSLLLAVSPDFGVIHKQILIGGAKKLQVVDFLLKVVSESQELGMEKPIHHNG